MSKQINTKQFNIVNAVMAQLGTELPTAEEKLETFVCLLATAAMRFGGNDEKEAQAMIDILAMGAKRMLKNAVDINATVN